MNQAPDMAEAQRKETSESQSSKLEANTFANESPEVQHVTVNATRKEFLPLKRKSKDCLHYIHDEPKVRVIHVTENDKNADVFDASLIAMNPMKNA